MNREELLEQISEKRVELLALRQQLMGRSLEKTHEIKATRREIARLLTQLNKAGN